MAVFPIRAANPVAAAVAFSKGVVIALVRVVPTDVRVVPTVCNFVAAAPAVAANVAHLDVEAAAEAAADAVAVLNAS
jgi:hypothetical protein